MIQQDLQGHMFGNDEKIGKLQEQIDMLVLGLHNMNATKDLEGEYETVGNGDFKGNLILILQVEACIEILFMLLMKGKG